MALAARRLISYCRLKKGAALSVVALAAHFSKDEGFASMEGSISSKDLPDYWMKRQGEHAYLEEVLGEKALSWVTAENAATVAKLGDPKESPLYARILSILESKEKIPYVRKIGDYYYNFWQDGANPRGVWRRTTLASYRLGHASTVWETVLDLDALGQEEGESWVYKGAAVLDDGSPGAHHRCLLKLSRGGADAVVVREFNLASKAFVAAASGGFVVPEAKTSVSWKDKDTLLVGTVVGTPPAAVAAGGSAASAAAGGSGDLTASGYPRTVREWARGEPLAAAPLVFEGDSSDVSVGGYVSRHRGHAYERRHRSLTFWTALEELRVLAKGSGGSGSEAEALPGPWVSLDGLLPRGASLSHFADQAVVTLKSDFAGFQAGTLLTAPLPKLLRAASSMHAVKAANGKPAPAATAGAASADAFAFGALPWQVLFAPSARESLASWTRTHNYLVVSTLDNVKSKVAFWEFRSDGVGGGGEGTPKFGFAGAEAEGAARGCSVSPVDDDESDMVFWTTSGFTQPSTLSLADAAQGPAGLATAEPLRALPAMFNAAGQEVTQGMATSKDGTQVPYFMVKGPTAGPAPTLLYGYGGFRISLEASYVSTVGAGWLERGGTFVQANIRGGGEFGPPWHAAALREKRHKAYEDMEAVAEDLVARGLTTPAQLAVRGGSNGGLLVGNMLTRRPDLFGAVVCAVPLLDMRRFHQLLAGASWVGEYGDPDNEADWAFLKQYSAYHQIDPAKAAANLYPPLLMTTSTRDDRVHPYHARSFVKRLQDVKSEGGVPAGSGQDLYYYENIEGGHGGAADAKQQAFMTVLYLEFLKATIGKGGGLVDK